MQSIRLRLAVIICACFLPVGVAWAGGEPNCTASQNDASGASGASAQPSKEGSGHGFDPSSLDKSASPCTNFFQFADGGWIAKNPIPAAYPSWGRFNELNNRNQEVLHQILEEAAKAKNAPAGSVIQKIGDFYASCMDTEAIEAAGIKPLLPELKRIADLNDVAALETEIARLQGTGVNAVFFFNSTLDFKNSTQVIGIAAQSGLGLPDRDYYTKKDEKSKQLRDAYVQHVTKMFQLMGDDAATAAAEAKTVMDVETKLAEASMTRVERRDPDATYHKMDRTQLKLLTPDFSWETYFQNVGFPTIEQVNVAQPDFFKTVNQMLTAVPLADWRTYLRWHLIHTAARRLPSKFVEEDFNFYGRTLTGTTEILPRWKRCVTSTDNELGEALGQEYVKRAFPPEAKASALKMVHNLIAALHEDLATLPWMGAETRQQASKKLDAIMIKIGYPDKWRDYSSYAVDRGSYVENVFRGDLFEFKRNLAQIGKPVDRTEWGMTPPTVNAYYNPTLNEIVFPAGILQPPFYDPKADDAINYGGVGAVIGHELTHGFDDQGSKFDADGNLKNWWTPEDLKNFQERAECVRKQFDSFVVEGDLHENGKLVLGESIADLGGLTIAHAAFERTAEAKSPGQKIDGFTPEQRFFLAWAQIWATNVRPEYARVLVNTNPHPLGQFRTNGPLSNLPEFAAAFSCKEPDSMVRPAKERCRIW